MVIRSGSPPTRARNGNKQLKNAEKMQRCQAAACRAAPQGRIEDGDRESKQIDNHVRLKGVHGQATYILLELLLGAQLVRVAALLLTAVGGTRGQARIAATNSGNRE